MSSSIKSLQVLSSLKALFLPVANSGKVISLVSLGASPGSKASSGSAVGDGGGAGHSVSRSGTFAGGEGGGRTAATFAGVASSGHWFPVTLEDVSAAALEGTESTGRGIMENIETVPSERLLSFSSSAIG